MFDVNFDTSTTLGVTVTAVNGGAAEGADGNGITVAFVDSVDDAWAASTDRTYDDSTNTLTDHGRLHLGHADEHGSRRGDSGLERRSGFHGGCHRCGRYERGAGDAAATDGHATRPSGRDAGSNTFTVTADDAGTAANGVTVTI